MSNFVLVELTRSQVRHKEFPHTRASEQAHLMLRAIPFIEVAYDGYGFCIWRPDCERDAGLAFVRNQMRTELFIDAFVFAFAKEMQVELAERGREIPWRCASRIALADARACDFGWSLRRRARFGPRASDLHTFPVFWSWFLVAHLLCAKSAT